ncbi:MAG: Cna B-type domain-containing protein, partial [Lachnospiraceae bacterium]|nr:Cna B-type domain-containing protein [Lachnospiraceae bacterium]
DNTFTWTLDKIEAGKSVKVSFSGYINENTDNVDNLNGRFYINGEKIEADFSGEWRLLEASETEGPTSISTVCDGVTINVSAADGSVLPAGVEVKATKVSAASAVAEIEATQGIEILDAVAFDVVLIVNGEEVQPDGSVVVSFYDVGIESEEGSTVGVAHMSDDGSVENIGESDSTESVSVEANHFSTYVVYTTKISGTYSASNGVTTSSGDTLACFDFHVFANTFSSNYFGHVNGNFAIRDITGDTVPTFGLNNGDSVSANKQVFYVESLSAWNEKIANYDTSIFIFGPGVELRNENGYMYAVQYGKDDEDNVIIKSKVGLGKYEDMEGRLYTSELNYIDFATEFQRAATYSEELNTKVDSSDASVTGDQNEKVISTSSDADEVIITMTGEKLAETNLGKMSFEAKKAGQKFIVNVKLDASQTKYEFSSNGMEYKLAGSSLGNSESNAFYSGSIIWNFVNEDGTPYEGTIQINYNWLGTVLAPKATVWFRVVNGSVIADTVVKMDGESHKGDYSSSKISYTVTKRWEGDESAQTPVSVALYRRIRTESGSFADGGAIDRNNLNDSTKYEKVASTTINCPEQTSYTFDGLPSCDGWGYTCDYFVVEETTGGWDVSYSGHTIINTPRDDKTSKTVKKVWEDDNNAAGLRPASISVQLYADGVAKGDAVSLSAENSWTYSWTDLDKKSAGGNDIEYTVGEIGEVTGYTTAYSGDTFTITNTYDHETVDVSGTKIWNDNKNQDGLRPSNIKIQLLADGQPVEGKVLEVTGGDSEESWTWKFEDLDKYKYVDGETKLINYTFIEEITGNIKDYYTVSYSEDGRTVINTHDKEKTSISGTKTWDDSNNQDGLRVSSIELTLTGTVDGATVVGPITKTVNGDVKNNTWSWSFTDLDKYYEGEEISYSVTETQVTGYDAPEYGDNNEIINRHTPEKTSISGTKTWTDNNNQDGVRPESIKITLYAGTEKAGEKTVTAADNWSWSFT